MSVDWVCPDPREGLWGTWDRFVGPGATRAELTLGWGVALVAGVAAPLYALLTGLDWSGWQLLVAALLAFDLLGGVAVNATSAANRWYHRLGQGFAQHFGFVVVHAFHIFLVAWLFRGLDWAYFAAVYGYLLLATVLILRTPLYLQRPVALLLYCGALALGGYGFAPTPGLEWFAPVFFLKLLISHLLKEAPYRPG